MPGTGELQPPHATPTGAPYFSVVAAARNDDPDLLRRTQTFVNAWISQSKRCGLESELILVEWNPPRDREPLAHALHWSADTGPCQVRILEVPAEICARHPHAQAWPSYQGIARNIGIRRARGEFILATSVDDIYSDELMQFFASRRLEKGHIYRIDRHDVASTAPADTSVEEQLEHCRTHLIRLQAREGTFSITPEGLRANAPQDITADDSGVHFGEGWFAPERYAADEVFRWMHNDAEVLMRVREGGAVLLLEVEPGPGLDALPQSLQVLDDGGARLAEWNIDGRSTFALAVPPAAKAGIRSFRLRVAGAGRPVLNQPRILNLAVFRCDWAERNAPQLEQPSFFSVLRGHSPTVRRLLGSYRQSHGIWPLLARGPRLLARAVRLLGRRGEDIFQAGLDFQLGSGWSYLEKPEGERFRWVSQDAQFALRMPEKFSRLALLVEPGPGQGGQPFTLVVRHVHNGDTVIARASVRGLTYLEFDVPAPPGKITTLCFSAESQGSIIGADSRLLNFRVFACGAGLPRRSAPAPKIETPPGWPALIIGSRPVTKDWNLELEPIRPQLAEMGRPQFLHTNACGDFLLMARQHWFDLRGYPEVDLFTMHLDSLLCYAAHHAGVAEQVLRAPMRVYHLERGAPDGQQPIAPPEVESAAHDDLVWLIGRMRGLRAPVILNLPDWGLAKCELRETSPGTDVSRGATR
ncbi:MAG TPA: hypothetical protein VEV17_15565 [Bryobacteraceae bacterium]|nr:hypothetical protein [Bryobacteraceae bacterium]